MQVHSLRELQRWIVPGVAAFSPASAPDHIEKLAGSATQRIDVRGRTMTPGHHDARNHFSGGAADRLVVLD